MGYGHQIYLDKDFDRAALADAFKDIRTLIQRTEIKVVGPEGRPNSLPIVEDDRIEFNGANYNCVCDKGDSEELWPARVLDRKSERPQLRGFLSRCQTRRARAPQAVRKCILI